MRTIGRHSTCKFLEETDFQIRHSQGSRHHATSSEHSITAAAREPGRQAALRRRGVAAGVASSNHHRAVHSRLRLVNANLLGFMPDDPRREPGRENGTGLSLFLPRERRPGLRHCPTGCRNSAATSGFRPIFTHRTGITGKVTLTGPPEAEVSLRAVCVGSP